MQSEKQIKVSEGFGSTLTKDSRECKKTIFVQEQEEKKQYLEKVGVLFSSDGSTAKLAESNINDEKLELCIRCLKNDGNQLVYVLFERKGDTEYGIERKEQRITDKHIEDQKIVIDNLVNSFTGVYSKSLSNIKVNISIIHKYRLLKGIRSINSDKLPMNEVIEGLKDWLLENVDDSRVGVMELNYKQHIVIMRPTGYKNGLRVGGIFKEIFYEIAPHNDFNAFKGELYRRKLIICDRNEDCIDIQKTISRAKCLELGTDHVKVICFNFDDNFVNRFISAEECRDFLEDITDEEIELMFNEGNLLSEIYGEE